MIPASPCTHWLGHKFQARYSYGLPSVTTVKGDPEYAIRLVEASKTKTYERDVCVRCGATVEKTDA